jgi:hypothetical protein
MSRTNATLFRTFLKELIESHIAIESSIWLVRKLLSNRLQECEECVVFNSSSSNEIQYREQN